MVTHHDAWEEFKGNKEEYMNCIYDYVSKKIMSGIPFESILNSLVIDVKT